MTEDDHLESNRLNVEALAAAGDGLSKSRPVEHRIYFDAFEQRAGFVEDVRRLGFEIVPNDDDENPPPFDICVRREDRVDLASIHRVVMELVELVESYGGEYDGWESPVERA